MRTRTACILLAASTALASATQTGRVTEGQLTTPDGVRLVYRTVGEGNGPGAIVLHGGPAGDMSDAAGRLDGILPTGRVIFYDQRGGGRSELVAEPARLRAEDHVNDLEAVRARFGLDEPALLGLSWGAGLAILYAAKYPDRVSRLVLVSPMPIASKPYADERRARLRALMEPGALERFREFESRIASAPDEDLGRLCRERFAIIYGPYVRDAAVIPREAERRCTMPPAAIRNVTHVQTTTLGSLGNWDFRPILARLVMPALVVEGELSTVPLDSTRAWAQALPAGRLLLIPQAGHAHFVEAPDALVAAAREFLAGRWPAGARPVRP